MNNPIINFAMNMMANNPAIANNPRNKELFEAIQSGDAQRGQQIAQNLCDSYGVTPEQAVEQAKKHFGIG